MADYFLGVEGGGTRTVALFADTAGRVVARTELGPGNLRLMTDAALFELFSDLAANGFGLRGIGVGLAGCREASDRARVEAVLGRLWPGVPRRVDHDLETAWQAAYGDRPWKGRKPGLRAVGRAAGFSPSGPQMIVISGTGSCWYGKDAAGKSLRVGGWGHQLGDWGSGYDMAVTALRDVVAELELTGEWPPLGARILRRLMLNAPADLLGWMPSAGKDEVAALAAEVFAAADAGDRRARGILQKCLAPLLAQGVAIARRLGARKTPHATVEVVLCGSVFVRQPATSRSFGRRLQQAYPGAKVRVLDGESAWGALALAYAVAAENSVAGSRATLPLRPPPAPLPPAFFIPRTRELSPTERRNPRSQNLDRLSVRAAVELMLSEDAILPEVIRAQAATLARLVKWVATAFRSGGRLLYVGAGTSGRLGVLDASECPPTFRTPPEQVQGIIAGGERALYASQEGAEDDAVAGAVAIESRGVNSRDVVLGIAASGRTPFVWGALAAARKAGATTALLCFNPHLEIPRQQRPDVVLALDVGPEILTGSTRLKAGTATKLVLNILTTLAMVQIGKVMGNLMVDLNPSNEKLRDRAARIVMELTGISYDEAWAACEKAGWSVGEVVRRLRPRRPRSDPRRARTPGVGR